MEGDLQTWHNGEGSEQVKVLVRTPQHVQTSSEWVPEAINKWWGWSASVPRANTVLQWLQRYFDGLQANKIHVVSLWWNQKLCRTN